MALRNRHFIVSDEILQVKGLLPMTILSNLRRSEAFIIFTTGRILDHI